MANKNSTMAQRGRLGGLTTAATHDTKELTRPARERSLGLQRFLEQVPDSVPEGQRVASAERLRKLHYTRMGIRSGEARRAKSNRA